MSPALTGVCAVCLMSLCESVCACVGGLALAVTCVRPVCPLLSLPVPPTCLWHTCVALGLTPAFVNRGRSRARVIGDLHCAGEGREGEANTAIKQQEKQWTEGQQEERRKNRIRNEEFGMKMRPGEEKRGLKFGECTGTRVGWKGEWRGNECLRLV